MMRQNHNKQWKSQQGEWGISKRLEQVNQTVGGGKYVKDIVTRQDPCSPSKYAWVSAFDGVKDM